MIPKIFFFGNILNPILTVGKKIYDEQIDSLNRFKVECNFCHRRGNCIKHGYYKRNYIISPTAYDEILILRMFCKACGRSHAILPEEIVPYAQYSIIFMYLVLYQYYVERSKVEAICDQFGIKPAVLYRWTRRFKMHMDIFLGVIESDKLTERDVLSWLREQPSYGQSIAAAFLAKTEHMPMQSHRNPTNTRQPVLA